MRAAQYRLSRGTSSPRRTQRRGLNVRRIGGRNHFVGTNLAAVQLESPRVGIRYVSESGRRSSIPCASAVRPRALATSKPVSRTTSARFRSSWLGVCERICRAGKVTSYVTDDPEVVPDAIDRAIKAGASR